ncbi:MAG: biopolymer transporter ExbD [Deltaproteobacteria bacterium]|jgi:biopolymer transport protein ExbD|nr:biopolymer transporter ExbD [Deltaproteobacteria bacterium]
MNFLSFEEEPEVALDLTPLIDAVFMLLVFFIMAATFAKPAIDVALPKAGSAKVKETPREKLTVTIRAEGRILFDDAPVSPEDIAVRLAPLPEETPIVFNVDERAPFALFVRVLDAARTQGRSNFLINAGRPEAASPGLLP